MLASVDVPWWSLPSVVAAAVAVYAYRTSGKGVSDAGLAGKRGIGAVRRGQSARSVAEMAANAALAMQTQVELQETKIVALEGTIERQNDTIALLRKDNERLERLVTQTTWGETLTSAIAANHKETLAAIAAIGAAQ